MTILENREDLPFSFPSLPERVVYDRRSSPASGRPEGEQVRTKRTQIPLIPNTSMLDYQSNPLGEQTPLAAGMMASSYHNPHHHQQITASASQSEPPYFAYPDTNTTSSSTVASTGRQSFTSPLMALHGMTDMKGGGEVASVSSNLGGYNPSLASYYTSRNSMLNATPHGISDILSRPDLHAQLQARLGQGMYYSSCSQAGIGSDTLSPTSKDISTNRSALYQWPSSSPTLQTPQSATWHNKPGK